MQRDTTTTTTSFTEGLERISSPLQSKYQQRQSSSIQVTPSKNNGRRSSSSEEMNNFMSPSKSAASFPCSVFLTPSPCSSSYSEEMNNPLATENRLYLARLALEYQELVDRYGLCLSHLQEVTEEAEILRQENATLRMLNKDLTKRFSLLAENSLHQFQNRYLSSSTAAAAAAAASYPALSIINDFRSLSIGGANNRRNSLVSDVPVTSPTSVIATNNNNNQVDPKRVSLPKSISIRSSGYLKMNQAAVNKAAASSRTIRVRLGTQPVLNPVHVTENDKEGDDEKSPLELDVYNQGMFKTELCNKWQETGACPYGEHCQFAHGINELRPIIRHPRYKTEVCRMVLSGDICPYGHRCHFRHALTDEEKLIAASAAAHGGAYH